MATIAPATPKQVREAIAGRLRTISGCASAFAYEPERLGELPCLTLLLARVDPRESATGPRLDCTYSWELRLYVNLSDWQKAQEQLEELIPAVLQLWRDDPTLADLVEWWKIADTAEPLIFNGKGNWLRKSLLLQAVIEETPT